MGFADLAACAAYAATRVQGQMNSYQSLFLIIGIAMCALVMVQMGLWAAQSLTLTGLMRRRFDLSRTLLNQQIESVMDRRVATPSGTPDGDRGQPWTGYRTFVVRKVVPETKDIVSVYLDPDDGKPITSFLPGQHLTIKVPVPGQSKPVVRCYSLSSAPHPNQYRISVKAITTTLPPRPQAPQDSPRLHHGLASHFINQSVCAGDYIEVKAPAGHFVLDEKSDLPVVLLAGGIGVTPMISMLEHLRKTNFKRKVILLYGVRSSVDYAFGQTITKLTSGESDSHAIRCFSRPLPTDVRGQDFEVQGFVSVDLLKQVLPNNHCQFYLCGPPAFMQSIYDGLIQWQVPESRINYEAFGPASIDRKTENSTVVGGDSVPGNNQSLDPVKFAKTNRTLVWSDSYESLLEMAEANQIFPDSGCRAGSCGSCETTVISGKVAYPQGQSVDCSPGACLLCLAKPEGPVELDL